MKEENIVKGDILPPQIMARREDWNDGINLYARVKIVGVSEAVALPIAFEERKPGMPVSPFLHVSIQVAQQFMDELWQCGLRPTEGTGSAGSLAATERHLNDMRKIVMKKLEIE